MGKTDLKTLDERGGGQYSAGKGSVLSQKKKEFLRSQNNCCLCGRPTDTRLEHVPLTRFAVERAQCRHCKTLVRVKNHSIQ